MSGDGCCGPFVPGAGSGGGGGGGIDGITVEDDGVALPGLYTTLNFIGDVEATDAGGGVADITVGLTPDLGTEYFDDFTTDRLSFLSVAGGGSNGGGGSDMGANGPGTYTQTVTAASVDGARIVGARASGSAATIYFGGGVCTFRNRHLIPTLSDGTNRIIARIGMHDATASSDVSDGVYLEYDLAGNGNQNYWLCAANNGTRSKADTGIAAQAGVIRKVVITVNAGGTSASVTIDGVAGAAPVVAQIPVTAARNTYVGNLQTFKSLGAGALTVIHDYWGFRQIFTTPR